MASYQEVVFLGPDPYSRAKEVADAVTQAAGRLGETRVMEDERANVYAQATDQPEKVDVLAAISDAGEEVHNYTNMTEAEATAAVAELDKSMRCCAVMPVSKNTTLAWGLQLS